MALSEVLGRKFISYSNLMKNLVAYILLLSTILFSQEEEIQRCYDYIQKLQFEKVQELLPNLQAEYSEHYGVKFLTALVESNGDLAADIFSEIVAKDPYGDYHDDSLLKLGEYFFTRGQYRLAKKHLREIPIQHPESKYVERSLNLLMKSYRALDSIDSAEVFLRAVSIKMPDLDIEDLEKIISGETLEETFVPQQVVFNPKYYTQPSKKEEKEEKNLPVESEPKGLLPVFTVQIGAFGDYGNAIKEKSQFSAMGYSVKISEVRRANNVLHLVWVGEFATKKKAQQVSDKFARELSINPIVREIK